LFTTRDKTTIKAFGVLLGNGKIPGFYPRAIFVLGVIGGEHHSVGHMDLSLE